MCVCGVKGGEKWERRVFCVPGAFMGSSGLNEEILGSSPEL